MNNVAALHHGILDRNQEFAPALDARDDQFLVYHVLDVPDCLAEQIGIGDRDDDAFEMIGVDADGVVIVLHLALYPDAEDGPDDKHGQDDAEHAERIGHGIAHSRHGRVQIAAHLVDFGNGLLGGAKAGRVGDGAAHDAGDHFGSQIARVADDERHGKSQKDYRHGEYVQLKTVAAECAEETRAHVDAYAVDEQNEAELLGEMQHVGVDFGAEVCQNDAGEQDAGNSQFDLSNAQLADQQADEGRQTDVDKCCRQAGAIKQVYYKFHNFQLKTGICHCRLGKRIGRDG